MAGWTETGHKTRKKIFFPYFNAKIKGNWLDIGCGPGSYSQLLNKKSVNIISIDYSFPTLYKSKKQHLDLLWVNANAYHLPIKSKSADGVICLGVLQTISDINQVSLELNRVIKDEGIIWIDGLNAWCMIHWIKILNAYFRKKIHLRYITPNQVKCDSKKKTIYWMPILPRKLQFLQSILLREKILFYWQKYGLFTRFLSHGFLMRIE